MAKHRPGPGKESVAKIGGRVIGQHVNRSGGSVNPATTRMTVRKRDQPTHGRKDGK